LEGITLGQTKIATLIARKGCCPARVPVAERFAIHKLLVSQLRVNRDTKTDKDIFQPAVLLVALGEEFPGAIESAVEDLPVSAYGYLVGTLPFAVDLMQGKQRASKELLDAIARIYF
jgi:hypothetical protein